MKFLDSTIVTRFAASVRNARSGLGISQEELAERADLHRSYIADIERGSRNITLRSIDKLAKGLGVSNADLLAGALETAASAPDNGGQPWPAKLANILLVEDDPKDEALILRALGRTRIVNRTQVVRDGSGALDYVFGTGRYADRPGHSPPHVILLDVSPPKVTGIEVLRRLRRDRRTEKLPVIVISALPDSPELRESRRLGAIGCLVKPVDFCNFIQVMSQLGLLWGLLAPTAEVNGAELQPNFLETQTAAPDLHVGKVNGLK
jgi:CheY-like chemotaxis protein/DNA-binding XRE family transcriptional regulator